jgi:hypothetical protein
MRILYCLLLLGAVQAVFGQSERTSVTGTVTDSTKAAVPDANVAIRNVATNIVNRTATNSVVCTLSRPCRPDHTS